KKVGWRSLKIVAKLRGIEMLATKGIIVAREANLRKWLKSVWGPGLQWVEPGHGGSIGMGDCLLPVDCSMFPLELKVWQRSERTGKLRMRMRPSQIRFHHMSNIGGIKTGIMVLVDASDIYFIPGYACPTGNGVVNRTV